MLYIDLDATRSQGQAYIDGNPGYTPDWWLYGADTDCFTVYHIPGSTGIPQTLMFDRDGYQRFQRLGRWTEAAMIPIIEELL